MSPPNVEIENNDKRGGYQRQINRSTMLAQLGSPRVSYNKESHEIVLGLRKVRLAKAEASITPLHPNH